MVQLFDVKDMPSRGVYRRGASAGRTCQKRREASRAAQMRDERFPPTESTTGGLPLVRTDGIGRKQGRAWLLCPEK